MVCASRSWSSTTSTPRWASLLTKSAWSRWAFSTHITSSNSSSSLFVGVRWASPGAQTSTLSSRPTSECTPYVEETDPCVDSVIVSRLSPGASGGCSQDEPAGPQRDRPEDASGHDHRTERDLGRAEQP